LSSTPDNSELSEWQAARDVLDKFDERLHDLRKIGFSFITGLLTVDSLLATIANSWKLAALVATLFLIVPLDLIDRNYRVLMTAASIRAEILEKRSRMDLTQSITRMVEAAHAGLFFEAVYVILTLAVLLLGWIVLGARESWDYWMPFIAFSFVTVVAVWYSLWRRKRERQLKWLFTVLIILVPMVVLGFVEWVLDSAFFHVSVLSQGLPLHYHLSLMIAVTFAVICVLFIETTVHINEWVDFGIDGYEYDEGDSVMVMISNLGHEDLELSKLKKPVWSVYAEESPTSSLREIPRPEAPDLTRKPIDPGKVSWSDHRWLFSTEGFDPGLYRVIYNGPVYFRDGRFPHRRFHLLNPEDKNDGVKLGPKRLNYTAWNDAAQRFRVNEKKKPGQINVSMEQRGK